VIKEMAQPNKSLIERSAVCSLPAETPLGKRLRVIRTGAGFSQERLASRIDVSIWRVRGWENGPKLPAEHELKKLAEALGVTVQELTGIGESQKGG
jgi:transcriptional regulator with XRE-family HTH domain